MDILIKFTAFIIAVPTFFILVGSAVEKWEKSEYYSKLQDKKSLKQRIAFAQDMAKQNVLERERRDKSMLEGREIFDKVDRWLGHSEFIKELQEKMTAVEAEIAELKNRKSKK